jgi:2-polyprenyl-3-methyl-5-hydroxy-6-metoxy-1,4-benzoquinol methylase
MITYTQCPVCAGTQIQNCFSAKDYTVSNEVFTIAKCNDCTHLFTQNVASQNDIGKYYQSENYISHSDTQAGIINKLYHTVRKRTLAGKKNLVQKETGKQQGKILDIGCGTGAFLNTMKEANWNTTGLEPDDTARKKALELYKIEARPSHEIFDLPNDSYDAISMWHVLEHVHQVQEYIAQLKNMLTANGKIFIAVPNYTSYDAQHYGAYWAAYDVPRHLYHFSPASMKTLVEQHGLKIKKIKPMWFDSFYVSMLSEQYKNGKANIVKAFFIGLLSNVKTMFDKEKCSSLIYVIEKK